MFSTAPPTIRPGARLQPRHFFALCGFLAACGFALLCSLILPAGAAAQLPATLEVQVMAASSGAPELLSGVRVEVSGTPFAGSTDQAGRVRFRGLPPGTHEVRASHIGFGELVREVEVANGRTTRLELELVPRPILLDEVEVEGLRRRGPAGAVILRPADALPGARTVAELVEMVPGVSVVRRGGPGAPSVPSIRGSDGNQVLVLVDGVPLNALLTGEADLSSVELSDVDRVVVVTGAAASRYGAGALAGAILVETGTGSSSALSGRLLAGSHGEMGGLVAAARPLDAAERWRLDARVQAEESRGDFLHAVPEFRGGGEARRINAHHHALRGHLSLSGVPGGAEAGEGRRVRIRVHGEQLGRGSPGTVVQPSRTGEREELRGGLTTSLEGGGARGGWRVGGNAAAHRAEHRDPSPPFGPAFESTTRVREIDLQGEGWTEWEGWSLQGGLTGRHRGLRASALDEGAPTRIRELGGWVESSWSAGHPSGQEGALPGLVRVTGTLRGDLHDLSDEAVLSPSLGAEFTRGDVRLGVRWARAFSPPSLADLFFEEGVLVRSNPELGPERVRGEWSAEAGWEGAAGPLRSELQLSLFRGDVDGTILWFPDHRFIWSPDNYDVARRGGSVSGELRWPSQGLSIQGSLDHTQVSYTGPVLSGQVVYRPEWTGSVTTLWEADRLQLRSTLRTHGSRRSVPGSELNSLDPFTTLDSGVALPVSLGSLLDAHLELTVRNALDVRASFLADYPLPGRWWTLSVRLDRGP